MVVPNFLFIKKYRYIKLMVSTKKNKPHNCFQHWSWAKKSILEWFLKDHVTLKTGVMMLKIQLYHHTL